jgi:hypothetical protein
VCCGYIDFLLKYLNRILVLLKASNRHRSYCSQTKLIVVPFRCGLMDGCWRLCLSLRSDLNLPCVYAWGEEVPGKIGFKYGYGRLWLAPSTCILCM